MQPDNLAYAVMHSIAGLLPMMKPFSTAPLFLSLTAGMPRVRQRQQALKACIYAFLILASFLLLGDAIINVFGISMPGIRIAGGLIIGFIGFSMLFQSPPADRAADAAAKRQTVDVAITPLAMSNLAVPGSIALALTASGHVRADDADDMVWLFAAIPLGTAISLVIANLVYVAAAKIVRFVGASAMDAISKIAGFLLICIGAQFSLDGVADYCGIVPPTSPS